MSRNIMAALCAVAALCATPASATVFTYTFQAEGTGSRVTEYSASGPIFEALSGAAITITVDIAAGDDYDGLYIDGRPGGIAASATGITFFDAPTTTSYVSFSGRGTACFANPQRVLPATVGTVAIDPSCGSLSFRQSSPGGYGANFSGTITGLQVTAGGGIPGTLTARVIAAVPEPSTWALMLAGFGMVGYAMRRRRSRIVYA